MTKVFRNSRGAVFARLEGEILYKSEKQGDRLHVSGGRSHAIDADLLDEALAAGGRVLRIKERGQDGGVRVFEIPLEDIRRHGRPLRLAGVQRWSIPLAACTLLYGQDEEWRLAERQTLLEADNRRQEVEAIREEQLTLFSDQEKGFWKTRLLMGWEQSSGSGRR